MEVNGASSEIISIDSEPRGEKPVFGVSDNVRFKPVCSATETN